MKSAKRNILSIILFAIYILALTGLILFKLPFFSEKSGSVRAVNLIPFQGSFNDAGVLILREIIYNTMIFIPLGIYICMLKNKWSFMQKVLPIIGLTAAYEIIQYVFAIGRADITDIIDNTLGGIIGICIYSLLFKIFKEKTTKVVNILALVVTICALLLFVFLFFISHRARTR